MLDTVTLSARVWISLTAAKEGSRFAFEQIFDMLDRLSSVEDKSKSGKGLVEDKSKSGSCGAGPGQSGGWGKGSSRNV